MSSVQQKSKNAAAASLPYTSSSETQAKPHTTKVGRSNVDDSELYESTQLATQSNSPTEIKPDSSVAKVRGSPIDRNEAEESTQLASSLQSEVHLDETKVGSPVQESKGRPANEHESTQLASSLQSPSVRSKGEQRDVEESTQLASSLQSISPSQRKELKSRVKEAREDLFKDSKRKSTNTALQGVSSTQAHSKTPLVKKDDISLDEITETLEKASSFMPEARLVIRSLYSNRAIETENYSLTYPLAKEIYEYIYGVIQSKNHVDFIFETPLYRYPPIDNSLFGLPPKVDFPIIYDPVNDNCLLINRSTGWDVFLTVPDSRRRIEILGSHVLYPGIWTISVKGQSSNEYYRVLAILIREKRFSVSIYKENVLLRSKRAIEGDEGLAKRQRLNDGKSKIAVNRSDLMDKGSEKPLLDDRITRDVYNKTISPILDLADGEVAVVELSTAGSANTEDSYQLQRIKNIVKLQATSVFTCQHSKVAGDVVAKVLRYSSDSIYRLADISRSWKQEKRALGSLNHKNIVSLKALDGRAFAFYLEHLPPSLNAVRELPLDLSDAKTILHDISSALAYLSTQDIIHYDIKPANIAYSPDRGAVLMDFGMADSIATKKKPHGGTPWFVPPDVLEGKIRGFPGDIWALGVTMLLILQKIALPSSPGRPVYIHQLHDKQGYSRERTEAWFTAIEKVRHNNLNLKNEVERLIFEMLHEDGPARVEAATIELALRERKEIA